MLMLKTNHELVVPSGEKNKDPIIINLKYVKEVQARINEIAALTSEKAPELLSVFNIAAARLNEQVVFLERELNIAHREADKIKSVILLDRIADILKQKGLASSRSPTGSEDLRKAVLAVDKDYQEAMDKVNQIECVIQLLKGQEKSLLMAFGSAKRILEGNRFYNNSNLKAGNDELEEADVYVKGQPDYSWKR